MRDPRIIIWALGAWATWMLPRQIVKAWRDLRDDLRR
jgi:hypothetical protein